MKVLIEGKVPDSLKSIQQQEVKTIQATCPICNSVLEIESGDWSDCHTAKCPVCGRDIHAADAFSRWQQAIADQEFARKNELTSGIMEFFDFDKVAQAMRDLNLEWALPVSQNIDGGKELRVPTKPEIIAEVIRIIDEAFTLKKTVYSGGLCANYIEEMDGIRDGVTVEFILAGTTAGFEEK